MSTFFHPVGPQSAKVYWRRRLLALIVLVVVIVVVALLIVRPGSSAPAERTDESAPAASASPSPSPTAELIDGAECLPENVRVDAVTDMVSYQPGDTPQLAFTITNIANVSCTLNVGTTQQTFVITSGAETYWSSKDCETGAVDYSTVLEPNLAQTSTPLAWGRTRSSADTCDSAAQPVPSGGATYALTVTVGAITPSTPTSFLLY